MLNAELGMRNRGEAQRRIATFRIPHSAFRINLKIIAKGIIIFTTFVPSVDFFAKSKYLIIS